MSCNSTTSLLDQVYDYRAAPMATKRSYSIIIVTWNALHHLQHFLPSVMMTDQGTFEIIIADNASDDGSIEWVKQTYPSCKIVRMAHNRGYCGGNNRAADVASGDILVFLNNDVRPEPDWLEQLDAVFDDSEVAAAQPKILSSENPELFEYAGAAGGFLDTWSYPFCRGRLFSTVEKDKGQYDSTIPVFWASGAALAIRREQFYESGKFDESFEFHMEEIDLCWRLHNRGFKVVCEPKSIVYHLGGGSLPTGSARKIFFNFRNSLQMIWKNASSGWLWRKFFLRLMLDGVAGLRFLFQGEIASFLAIFKAHIHFYIRWPRIHLTRRRLQKERQITGEPSSMIQVNLLHEYFIKGKRRFSELVDQGAPPKNSP